MGCLHARFKMMCAVTRPTINAIVQKCARRAGRRAAPFAA